DVAWATLWASTPVIPLDIETMIQWLRVRSDIGDLIAQLSAAERQTMALQNRQAGAIRLIQAEYDALKLEAAPFAAQPLRAVIETAAAVERANEDTAKSRRDLEMLHRKATNDAARKRKALETGEADWNGWTTQWSAALKALQLAATSTPESVDAQMNAIDD